MPHHMRLRIEWNREKARQRQEEVRRKKERLEKNKEAPREADDFALPEVGHNPEEEGQAIVQIEHYHGGTHAPSPPRRGETCS